MMISRYMIPKKIKGYRSGTVNALIDCVQALWPIQSATLLTTVTAAGTKQEVKRFPKPPKEPDVVSWRTERTGTLQITVTAGFVEFLPATYLMAIPFRECPESLGATSFRLSSISPQETRNGGYGWSRMLPTKLQPY